MAFLSCFFFVVVFFLEGVRGRAVHVFSCSLRQFDAAQKTFQTLSTWIFPLLFHSVSLSPPEFSWYRLLSLVRCMSCLDFLLVFLSRPFLANKKVTTQTRRRGGGIRYWTTWRDKFVEIMKEEISVGKLPVNDTYRNFHKAKSNKWPAIVFQFFMAEQYEIKGSLFFFSISRQLLREY